jgi:sugar phosphate isomerase/epimerase
MSKEGGFSRRDFVRAGAELAAGLAASGNFAESIAVKASAGEACPIPLGLASYTFRNFNRAQLIGFLKQLNVLALNAKDIKDHLPAGEEAESAALADYAAAGIKLHAAGAISFAKNGEADIRAKFEYCKRAGVPVIVASDPSQETLPRIEKFVQQYDLRFAIHNHGPEDKLWRSPLNVLNAVRGLDPRMGCCIDVGHTVRAGIDVVQAIRAAGPRLFNIHLKDLANFESKESQVAVGAGTMPVREIFAELMAAKYEGFVDLEYEIHPDDPLPGVKESFAYMRGVLAGMGFSRCG